MHTKNRLGLMMILAPAFVLASTATAWADQTVCGAGTTLTGNVDNVVVAGGICDLFNATVSGNVKVEVTGSATLTGTTVAGNVRVKAGGELIVNFNNTIDGHLHSNGAAILAVQGGNVTVGGNLRIKDTLTTAFVIGGTEVGGNVRVQGNVAVVVQGATIDGSLRVKNNGGGDVSSNDVGNNLRCDGNGLLTHVFGPNTVTGKKKGQCAEEFGF